MPVFSSIQLKSGWNHPNSLAHENTQAPTCAIQSSSTLPHAIMYLPHSTLSCQRWLGRPTWDHDEPLLSHTTGYTSSQNLRRRGGKKGGREGGREGERERGREGEREGGKEGGREHASMRLYEASFMHHTQQTFGRHFYMLDSSQVENYIG